MKLGRFGAICTLVQADLTAAAAPGSAAGASVLNSARTQAKRLGRLDPSLQPVALTVRSLRRRSQEISRTLCSIPSQEYSVVKPL